MNLPAVDGPVKALVAAQLGRVPREPWTVAASCTHGYPTVIASPPVLEDGTRFPTMYWLTCPYLTQIASRRESDGALAAWAARLADEPQLSAELLAADSALRERRAASTPSADPCAAVGIAGQLEPTAGAKCLHAHIALYLAGIDDVIGRDEVFGADAVCSDVRCRAYETPQVEDPE